MNTTEITTAARRIARKHNDRIRSGFAGNGKLVFSADGTGGAWYSDSSYGFSTAVIVLGMSHHTITAVQVQEMLDERAAQAQEILDAANE